MNNCREEQYHAWKLEFRKLDKEVEHFLENFLQNKVCKCKNDECKHFKEKRTSVFGKRIDELYNMKLKIGFSTISEVINQN